MIKSKTMKTNSSKIQIPSLPFRTFSKGSIYFFTLFELQSLRICRFVIQCLKYWFHFSPSFSPSFFPSFLFFNILNCFKIKHTSLFWLKTFVTQDFSYCLLHGTALPQMEILTRKFTHWRGYSFWINSCNWYIWKGN